MTDTTKHICRVGTARIDYQGRVEQRVLNTTFKSDTGLGQMEKVSLYFTAFCVSQTLKLYSRLNSPPSI